MAAPTPTARQSPTGREIPEGFKSKVTLSRKPDISFFEIDLTPPSLDGGGPINTTTQFNTKYHTKRPRTLIDVGDVKLTAAYDPDVITRILLEINVEQTITFLYPDGSTFCFYGWLMKFIPSQLKEGSFPNANIEICCSNWDPVNSVEAGPVFAEAPGT